VISALSRLVHGACHQTLNIGKPLRNMAFDATGSYLQTEIGSVALNAVSFTCTSGQIRSSKSTISRYWVEYR